MKRILFLIGFLLLGFQAQADDAFPIGGRIFSDFYFPARNWGGSSDLQQISASLWLQADPKIGEHVFSHFVLALDEFAASSVQSSQLRLTLREGYAGYSHLGWELRAGKMIIPWGKSDFMSPVDFLTGRDYTFFNPDSEVQRVGAASVSLAWTPLEGNSPLSFTFVSNPVFPQSKLLVNSNLIPAGTSVGSTQTPAMNISNIETAFKIAYTGQSWDLALIAFRGYNHLPDYQFIPGSFSVAPSFHPIKAAGAETSVVTGKWTLRGDFAYVWTDNDDGTNTLAQPSHFDSTLGLERPIVDDFRFQAQAMFKYYPQYTPPSTSALPSLASANAMIQNYQEQFRPSGSIRLAYSGEKSDLSGELFLLLNFIGWDYLVRPQLAYKWTDSFKTTLGVDYYGGPGGRPLGMLAPYSALYAEAKYLF